MIFLTYVLTYVLASDLFQPIFFDSNNIKNHVQGKKKSTYQTNIVDTKKTNTLKLTHNP
jgi:hypothetical protein